MTEKEDSGCTNCAGKGGCDERKDEMFGSLVETLASLYPRKAWGQMDDALGFASGVSAATKTYLERQIRLDLGTATYSEPGSEESYCDYIWVLCLGREPSLWQIAQGLAPVPAEKLVEIYLRVALSSIAPFAAVQEVVLQLRPRGEWMMLSEEPRGGVFDPQLLRRMQKLVATLESAGLTHLDFGEITTPPEGYSGGDYLARYGSEPATVNYLFYPESPTAITTRYLSR